MPGEQPKSLIVVDDDELVRDSLVAVLQNADYAVVGYSSGVEFLKALPSLNLSCVILDVRMPQMSGLDVLGILMQSHADIPVIVMSGFADVATAVTAMQSGASDFVEKPVKADEFLDTVKRVLQKPRAAVAKADGMMEGNANFSKLSAREIEVLSRLVQGKQNKVVARELGISHRTVEVHRSRIMQRLGVSSFAELVRVSVQSGLRID